MGIVTSCLNASSRQLLTAASDGDAETVRQVADMLLGVRGAGSAASGIFSASACIQTPWQADFTMFVKFQV